MDTEIKATFKTRREAELAVEHLVQEHGLNRTDIFVQPEGSENTAGQAPSGADKQASLSEPRNGDRAQLAGSILLSIGCDQAKAGAIQQALKDVGGSAA